ncbi:MAG: hypothetical protein EBS19_16270, partial [Spirochaetia bacterium]|nr:hypothetical protein [Spirochaetia bacterium]
IHLLINLCFTLFLLKANNLKLNSEKLELYFKAFLLAVIQHGVVDFFLIPSSKFGIWLSVAMFMGIWVWVVRDLRKYVYHSEEATSTPKQLFLIDNESGNLAETSLS